VHVQGSFPPDLFKERTIGRILDLDAEGLCIREVLLKRIQEWTLSLLGTNLEWMCIWGQDRVQ
jgi:hypothetical protein